MYASKKLITVIFLSALNCGYCYAHGRHHSSHSSAPMLNTIADTSDNVICNVDISALNFGEYHNLTSQDVKTQAPIFIHCTGPENMTVNYTVALTQGTSSNYLNRTMQNASNPNLKLFYNLFIDPTLKNIWGDGNQGTSMLSGTCLTNTPCTQTIYAYIPAKQKAANVGEYYDDITATINY